MTCNEIIECVTKICRQHGAESLILFGSRAKGTDTARSDFDFCVKGVDDFYELLSAIDEIPTLYKIDLVNEDTCKNELLLKDIYKYGRKILL